MIVGCYTLDLYCDVEGCKNASARYSSDGIGRPAYQFTGETGGECRAKARRVGWKLDQSEGTASCPLHRKVDRVARYGGG